MLRNKFRKIMGVVVVLVMGVAIWQYIRQTSGNEYVAGALFSGLKFLLFLALVLWLVYFFDRRSRKREP